MVADVTLESFLDLTFLILWQFEPRVQLQVLYAGPDLGRYRAAQLADEGQLVLLGGALHDGAARPHLGHDTPGAPQVDRGAVVPLAEQELGGTVPEGDDAVRVAVWLALADAEGAGQPKVGELQNSALRDQDVGRLHVAVQDLVEVDEVKAVEKLLHHLLDFSQRELHVGVAQQAGEIVFTEVEDKVKRASVTVVRGRFKANNRINRISK